MLISRSPIIQKHYFGNVYRYGKGVKQDLGEVIRYYQLALEAGQNSSAFELGLMYYETKDYKNALKYYQIAAYYGLPGGIINLGLMYQKGIGAEVNCQRAAELYQKAANWNIPTAQYFLGKLYLEGKGVEQCAYQPAGD
jgi:TPR repeat protein